MLRISRQGQNVENLEIWGKFGEFRDRGKMLRI